MGKKTDNNDIESSCLQEIWDKIEKTIKNTSKKFIPTKKIKQTNKQILINKNHIPTFKSLREATNIFSLIKKVQKRFNLEHLNTINKKINKLTKLFLLLNFKNFNNTSDISPIPWKEWKVNIQENIKAIKEINLREEAMIRKKEIKKVIQKRCQDL